MKYSVPLSCGGIARHGGRGLEKMLSDTDVAYRERRIELREWLIDRFNKDNCSSQRRRIEFCRDGLLHARLRLKSKVCTR